MINLKLIKNSVYCYTFLLIWNVNVIIDIYLSSRAHVCVCACVCLTISLRNILFKCNKRYSLFHRAHRNSATRSHISKWFFYFRNQKNFILPIVPGCRCNRAVHIYMYMVYRFYIDKQPSSTKRARGEVSMRITKTSLVVVGLCLWLYHDIYFFRSICFVSFDTFFNLISPQGNSLLYIWILNRANSHEEHCER